MPKEKHAHLRAAAKSGAVDYVGTIIKDGSKQPRIVAGALFEIGILDQDYLSHGGLKSGPEGSTFALVYFVLEYAYVRVPFRKSLCDVHRVVLRSVINNYDLAFQPRDIGNEHPGNNCFQGFRFVIARHNDRNNTGFSSFDFHQTVEAGLTLSGCVT